MIVTLATTHCSRQATYPRSTGIPDLGPIDDAWYGNFSTTFGHSNKLRLRFAAKGLHVGMLVSQY